MAHGIGSVVALLSLAVLTNVPSPGAAEAIDRICGWIDQWKQDSEGPWWPGYVTPDKAARPRPSWCYGIAGTARAQQLAGMALVDTTRQRTAEAGMLAALRDPGHLDLLESEIGLCHGTAGLLQAAWRMSRDLPTPDLADELPNLIARLLKQTDKPVTDPELLDGAAGAALVLHTVGTGTCPPPSWDRFLLLS
jgi:hypothetical protein